MKTKILQLGAVTILAAAVLLSSCGRTTPNPVSEEGTTTSGAAGSTSESVSGGHSSLEAPVLQQSNQVCSQLLQQQCHPKSHPVNR